MQEAQERSCAKREARAIEAQETLASVIWRYMQRKGAACLESDESDEVSGWGAKVGRHGLPTRYAGEGERMEGLAQCCSACLVVCVRFKAVKKAKKSIESSEGGLRADERGW